MTHNATYTLIIILVLHKMNIVECCVLQYHVGFFKFPIDRLTRKNLEQYYSRLLSEIRIGKYNVRIIATFSVVNSAFQEWVHKQINLPLKYINWKQTNAQV